MTHDYSATAPSTSSPPSTSAPARSSPTAATATPVPTWLAFFKQVDAPSRGLSVHVVLDNLSAHMGPELTEWLAKKDNHVGPAFCAHQFELVEPRRTVVLGPDRAPPAPRRLHERGALVEALTAWAAAGTRPQAVVCTKGGGRGLSIVKSPRLVLALTRSNPRRVTSRP